MDALGLLIGVFGVTAYPVNSLTDDGGNILFEDDGVTPLTEG